MAALPNILPYQDMQVDMASYPTPKVWVLEVRCLLPADYSIESDGGILSMCWVGEQVPCNLVPMLLALCLQGVVC